MDPEAPLRRIFRTFAILLAASTLPASSVSAVDAPPPGNAGESTSARILTEEAAKPADPFLAELKGFAADARARANSIEALLPLWRAFGLRENLGTLAPLADLYQQLGESSASPPEVRALARFLLAQVQRSRGRLPSAAEQLAKLGFLNHLWVAGPFDNEGKQRCDTAYPPEGDVDLAARFPGKLREIGWRRLPEISRFGFVDLSAALSPSDETVAYVLSVLESQSDEKVVLHLGTSGASRLWVNGTRVFSDDRYHLPRFDQSAVQVTLRKGANRVLLKLCQGSGPHGFWLRVSTPSGERPTSIVNSAPESLPPAPKGAVAHRVLPTAVDYFRKRAEAAPGNARFRADNAEVLMHRQAFDTANRRDAAEAAKAAKLAPKDASIQLLAASTTEDSNERRRYLEAALAAQPLQPTAASALARYDLGHETPRRALTLLEAASEKWPSHFPLAILQAHALQSLGLEQRASAILDRLSQRFPDRPEVVREAAQMARHRERAKDAVALYRLLLGLRYDDLEARRSLVSLLLDLGDAAGALREQQEINTLDPWDVSSWLRTGELAAANGFVDVSKSAFARAKEIGPEQAEVFEREGRMLARLGETGAAVAALEHSLTLKPQDPQVKEALQALRRQGQTFGEEHALDAKRLIAETPNLAGEDAQILAQLTAVKVLPSGLASRFEQLVTRVQTARGVEGERDQWITYSPDRQELTILHARVFRPDGSVLESHTESERSLSDPVSKIYYDARGRIVSFPNLAPGDVLELSWKLEDTANDNLLSDYFGDLSMIQGESPKARFDYYLDAPASRPIFANCPSFTLEKTEQDGPDGSRLYHWSARNVPKIVPEPGMPGPSQVAAFLHLSTYKDWDSVGRFYWGLVRDQLTPTDEIKTTVKELLARVPPKDELATIRAIYRFVVNHTRYVGLEFGIHGYKPYKVDKVLARRFGDCKDKASLMHAMLEAAGIDSRLVLLRMRRLGEIDPTPASLAIFDHAILYVPSHDLWLDGTAELYGSRELPAQDRGATVLVIEPEGGSHLSRIPDGTASANLTRSEYEVTIAASGLGVLEGRTTVGGLWAPEYRRTYEASSTRKQNFEQGWARVFPGLFVKEVSFSDLTDIERDVELSYELQVPRFAQKEEGTLGFSPFGQSASYVESYAPLSSRKHDLVFQFPWTNAFEHRYTLPAGFAAQELPQDVDVRSPFGALRIKYRKEAGALRAEGEVSLGISRVLASEYPAFRAFLGQIDQALGRKIKLAPSLAPPKTTSGQ
jgi:tetratricopeptide (TPR) repeat protein